jgi:hypothetical protein
MHRKIIYNFFIGFIILFFFIYGEKVFANFDDCIDLMKNKVIKTNSYNFSENIK